MNLKQWSQQIEKMQAAINRLEERASPGDPADPQQKLLQESLEALHVAMEQLATTGEELHQQQDELVRAYEQAAAERQRYRELFEFAPDGYLVTDVQGKIRETNRAASRLLNTAPDLLQGRLLLGFVLPAEQTRLLDLLRQLQAGERIEAWNLGMRRRERDPFSASLVAQPVRAAPGEEITSLRWLLRDVSKHVLQERALQESETALAAANAALERRVAERTADLHASEARFRVVLQDSPVSVFQQDTELRYTWIYNPAGPFEPADIIGKNEDELLDPKDAERLKAIKQRVLETGNGLREEVFWERPEGTRWFDMRLEPLRDAEGVLIGLTGVSTDITNYHQAAEAQRFLDEVSTLLITSLDTDSLLQHLSRLIAERLHVACAFALPDEEDRIELRAVCHPDPERSELLHRWLEESLREQPEQHPFVQTMRGLQTVYLRDDATAVVGDWLPALQTDAESSPVRLTSLLAVALLARNQIVGVMGLLNDQPGAHYTTIELSLAEELARRIGLALDTTLSYETALHARTEAENALRTRDHIFRIITHDLKTPVTTVQGYLYLLRRQLEALDVPISEKLLNESNKMSAAMDQMSDQIEELLHIAQMQAGTDLLLQRDPIDLVALVRRIVDMYQQISERHPIQVQTGLEGLTVQGEALKLERVFSNLLSNAIKYSPGGGDVVVGIEKSERNDTPGVVVSVRDQGIGIPTAELPYLFEPFRRGSNVQPQASGTGLGLVSARYVVEQHGGFLMVASQEGEGSTFSAWLPLHNEL